jgi:hypothetical protein
MMQKAAFALMTTTIFTIGASAGEPFERHFEDSTLRIDFHHTGNAEEEIVAIDKPFPRVSTAISRSTARLTLQRRGR